MIIRYKNVKIEFMSNQINLETFVGKINIKFGKLKYECSSLAIFCETYKKHNFTDEQLKKLFVPTDEPDNYTSWKRKLDVKHPENNAKLYMYRPYLKVIKGTNLSKDDIKNETDILTFVLFNPSYANQYDIDSTVKNCAYVTSKLKYKGFEILNLLNIRNPKVDDIKPQNDEKIYITNNYNCYSAFADNIVFKNVVLAWGVNKNLYIKEMQASWDILNKLQKEDTKYYCFCFKGKNKTWHLGNAGWNSIKCPFKKNFRRRIKIMPIELDKNEKIEITKDGLFDIVPNKR